MTSAVKIDEGIEEYQSLSLYHELARQAPEDITAPTTSERHAFVDQMIAKVETSTNFTRARKTSLINRLEAARDSAIGGDTFYATQRIEARARVAKVALDDYYSHTARELGESVSQVRNRLSSSYEESRRERSLFAPQEWQDEYIARPGNAGLPMDRHTAFAMWRIDNEIAERQSEVTTMPTVTNHSRVQGTGMSAIGYDYNTGRLEVEFRSRQGQFYAYRDVPAEVAALITASNTPTAKFNELVRNRPEYQYATQDASDAAGVRHQCRTCGQFASDNHGCPTRGSSEEIAATTERARIQQQVVNARAAVAIGDEDMRLERYERLNGGNRELARTRVERENMLAEMSPDTTMRHRQNQRLSARLFPYHGDSGTFRCTALSHVRRIAGEEENVNVPVVAAINRVYDELSNEAVSIPMGTVTGRMLVNSVGNGYTVEAARTPGDSGEDQLKCTCLVYRQNYDCPHVRQLIGDMNRRINQDLLITPHVIADSVQAVNAVAASEHTESVTAQVGVADWHAGGDGVAYSGDEGAVAFQVDYKAARERIAAGEEAVPYMTENATDGLGSRDNGRGVGVELEFTFPPSMPYNERGAALSRIGEQLHEAGLTRSQYQDSYHAAAYRGYTDQHEGGWSFEEDGSVDGEIVSPIMYDEPETWENIAKVCEILERNGASTDARVGAHVHVSTHNYDHTVENHNRLLGMFHEHEDEIYRLASSPERGTHRSSGSNSYARPNPRRANGYNSVQDAAYSNQGYVAVNLEDTSQGSDSDHAEFRVWDGTLNPSVIQAQIKMSLAMTEAAFRDTDYTPTGHTAQGTNRRANRQNHGAQRRLTGSDWRASTEGVRSLADRLYRRHEDKVQLASLFAATKWSS